MNSPQPSHRNPWSWIPTLYFAEGLPYVMVQVVSVTMYKKLGVSNADIAFFTSVLYLPWFLKFAWSPFVDMFKTKRTWTVMAQGALTLGLFAVAASLQAEAYWILTLSAFAFMALSSATHDIAADGYYMLSLDQKAQAAFVGVRSTFYRLATIAGSGLLVMLAGSLETEMGNQQAWSVAFLVAAVVFAAFFLYHRFILPRPTTDRGSMEGRTFEVKQILGLVAGFGATAAAIGGVFYVLKVAIHATGVPDMWSTIIGTISVVLLCVVGFRTVVAGWVDRKAADEKLGGGPSGAFVEFVRAFTLFMKKREIWVILAFLLFYRFAEAQLLKLVTPFLLDPRDKGGLALTTSEQGFIYGVMGIIALTAGGLLGGWVISRHGLRRWLWPMVLIMHLPDLVFVYLSQTLPDVRVSDGWFHQIRQALSFIPFPEHWTVYLESLNLKSMLIIAGGVSLEQFGYGFGFTAYMMYMIMISQGSHSTAHYAICTGIMALGMMLPGMYSGALQELIGYPDFFLWVIISTVPGFVVAALVKIDPEFGKKRAA